MQIGSPGTTVHDGEWCAGPTPEKPVEGSGTKPSDDNSDGKQPWKALWRTFHRQLTLQDVSTEHVVGQNVQGLYQLL